MLEKPEHVVMIRPTPDKVIILNPIPSRDGVSVQDNRHVKQQTKSYST